MALAAGMSVIYARIETQWETPPTFNPCYAFSLQPVAERAKGLQKTWPSVLQKRQGGGKGWKTPSQAGSGSTHETSALQEILRVVTTGQEFGS